MNVFAPSIREGWMTTIRFRIGAVFPPEDSVARFVCGLGIAVNDLTITNEQTTGEFARPDGGRAGISLHYMYVLCAHYREIAKFLVNALKDPQVGAFVGNLPAEARVDLEAVRRSFSPWNDSFVQSKLKPVRDVVFHYMDWTKSALADALLDAGNSESGIDVGDGTYAASRYDFADEVIRAAAVKDWGSTESQIGSVLQQLSELVLAFTRFGHAAVTTYLQTRKANDISVSL